MRARVSGGTMKHRIGALLCLALGAVLIFSGVSFSAAGAVGAVEPTVTTTAPPPNPCVPVLTARRAAPVKGGFCGLGTITVTETTTANGQTPPESWTVTWDSTNCALPDGVEANHTFTDNGSTTYNNLFVYTNDDRTAQCSYTLSEQTVPKFDAAFTPAGPYTFSDEFKLPGARANAQPHVVGLAQPVALSNTGQKVATTSSAPSSSAPSSSATVASELPTSATAGSPVSGSAAPVLATTGPHSQLRGSVIAGVALCLFGGLLLIAGRRRPRGARQR
jgi:hypothetical protein